MKFLLLFILITFMCSISQAQEFFAKNHENGVTRTNTLIATSDSTYIQTGVDDNDDMFVYEVDRYGDTNWLKTYGGAQLDEAIDAVETTNGYTIVGNTESFGAGNSDIIVLRIDDLGNEVWAKTYGSQFADKAYSIINTADGGYLISGKGSGSNSSAILIKIDANGLMQWERSYTLMVLAIGHNVIQTSDGGFMLVGSFNGELKLLKLDATGESVWARSASAVWQIDVKGFGLIEMSNGNIAVYGDEQGARLNIFVMMVNPSGNYVWGKVFRQHPSAFDRVNDAIETADGGVLLSCVFETSSGLAKLSPNGVLEWGKYYTAMESTSMNYDYKSQLVGNWANGYALTANTESGLVSTDSLGRVPCYNYQDKALTSTTNSTLTSSSSASSPASITANDITTLITGNHSMTKFEINSFPNVSSVIVPDDCIGDGSITLDVSGGSSPYQVAWSTNCTGLTCSGLTAGNYSAIITDDSGCPVSEMFTVPHEATSNEICMVTVDPTSQFNEIMWEAPAVSHYEGFNIYRFGAGSFSLIDYVDYNSPHVYTDVDASVNPNQLAYRYKISVLDSCGYESELSAHHRTLLCGVLSVTFGTSTIQWNDYEGAAIDYFRIFRDPQSNGNWVLIDSVDATILSYTDNFFLTTCSYRVEAVFVNDCVVGGTVYSGSLSNSAFVGNVGLGEIDFKVSISPNPVESAMEITLDQFEGTSELSILNMMGQTIKVLELNGASNIIDVSELPAGMYHLLIQNDSYRGVKRFVKN